MALRNRLIFWGVIIAIVLLLAIWAFSPRAVDVDIVKAERGALTVAVREEGETRIHDVFEISAPVAGTLERISLEAGDCVYEGETLLAVIEPAAAPILDARSEAQLKAGAEAANAAVQAASAERDRVRAELKRAVGDADRARALAPAGRFRRKPWSVPRPRRPH